MENIIIINHSNEIISIFLALTTGTLSLISLVIFFTSFNIQARSNKAMNLLEELDRLSELENRYIGARLFRVISSYDRLINQENILEKNIISIVKFALTSISIIWLSILLIVAPSFNPIERIVLCIADVSMVYVLYRFNKFFDKLLNIRYFANLPSIHQLLDFNDIYQPYLLELAVRSSRIIITKIDEKYELSIGFPVNFTNITVSLIVYTYPKNSDLPNVLVDYDTDEGPYYNINSNNAHLIFGDKYQWNKLCKFSIELDELIDCNFLSFDIKFGTSKSYLSASYSIRITDIREFWNNIIEVEDVSEFLRIENSNSIPFARES